MNGIKPATPGLQDKPFIHYITAAPIFVIEKLVWEGYMIPQFFINIILHVLRRTTQHILCEK